MAKKKKSKPAAGKPLSKRRWLRSLKVGDKVVVDGEQRVMATITFAGSTSVGVNSHTFLRKDGVEVGRLPYGRHWRYSLEPYSEDMKNRRSNWRKNMCKELSKIDWAQLSDLELLVLGAKVQLPTEHPILELPIGEGEKKL